MKKSIIGAIAITLLAGAAAIFANTTSTTETKPCCKEVKACCAKDKPCCTK